MMKRFYFAGTFLILALSAAFIGYGMHLNVTSESYIGTMLASRAVSLSGIKVTCRDLYPEILLDYADLRARTWADAITRIDGRIEELYVTQGGEIEQGQPIAKIVNDDIPLLISRADADVAKAEAAYLQTAGTAERYQRLAAQNAIAASELEMSISQMKASKAELDAARIARMQMEQQRGFQIVTAPLSGSVPVVYRQPGAFVAKGTPVAMIADFSKMYFTKLIDDKEISNLAPIDGKFSLHLDIENMTEKAFDSAAGSSFDENTAFDVTITSVLPQFAENAPVRSVSFEADNHLGIMEIGIYTDVVIRKETPKRTLAIPQGLIFNRDDPKVWVSDADSRLAERGVKLGARDGEYVEVVEGLNEGDVVITSGTEGLEPGMRINVNLEELEENLK